MKETQKKSESEKFRVCADVCDVMCVCVIWNMQ